MAESDSPFTDAVYPAGLLPHGDRGTVLETHRVWLSELASNRERLIVAIVSAVSAPQCVPYRSAVDGLQVCDTQLHDAVRAFVSLPVHTGSELRAKYNTIGLRQSVLLDKPDLLAALFLQIPVDADTAFYVAPAPNQ